MSHFGSNVMYLEDEDIEQDGSLAFSTNGKPACIMVQGSFCGYCTQMKPTFSQFASAFGDRIFIGTIQIDGNPSEKSLAKRLSTFIPDYRGVPIVVGYDSNGKFVKVHDGERSFEALSSFANELMNKNK